MKLKIIALAVLTSFSAQLTAQTLKVEKGTAYSENLGSNFLPNAPNSKVFYDGKNVHVLNVIGSDKVVAFSFPSIETIEYKTFSMPGAKLESNTKIDFKKESGKNLKSPGYGMLNNNIICYGIDNPNKNIGIFAEFCDPANNLNIAKEIDYEATDLKLVGLQSFNLSNKFVTSPNGEYAAIVYTAQVKVFPRYNDHLIGIVFDKNMNKVGGFTQELTDYHNKPEIASLQLNNNGDLFAVVSNFNEGACVVKVKKGDEKAELKQLPLEGKSINFLNMQAIASNNFLLFGFTRNKDSKSEKTTGVFSYTMDSNLGLVKNQTNTDDLLNSLNIYSNSKKEITPVPALNGGVKEDLRYPEIATFHTDDDETVFIFQKKYQTMKSSTYTSFNDHYLDIYAVKISAKGDILWTVRIPRYALSNALVPAIFNNDNDEITLFYDDSIDNTSLDQEAPTPDAPLGPPNTNYCITAVKIEPNGNTAMYKTKQNITLAVKPGMGLPETMYCNINSKLVIPIKDTNNKFNINTFTTE